jgi:hypothetical protein
MSDFTPWNPNPAAEARVLDKVEPPHECPYCAGPVEITKNSVIYNGREYGDWPWIYLCVNRSCFASVGLHKETAIPLGTLAKGPLRKARTEAKNDFNFLWQSGLMARNYAYRWLAKQMKITSEQCHFGLFDEAQCAEAMEHIEAYVENPAPRPKPAAKIEPDWKQKLRGLGKSNEQSSY